MIKGRKQGQLAEKAEAIERAKELLRQTESRVLIDGSEKFRNLQQTGQAFVVPQSAEETAREELRVNTSKYKLTAALRSDGLGVAIKARGS